jgi:hypothetical protein
MYEVVNKGLNNLNGVYSDIKRHIGVRSGIGLIHATSVVRSDIVRLTLQVGRFTEFVDYYTRH